MKLHVLERSQRLPVSLSRAWEFFSSPANLPAPPFPGLEVGWVTEITHVVEPLLFVDEQRFGPYRFWHHQHHFTEIPGGVEVRDVVHYALPRGTRAAGGWLVGRRLRAVFDHRARVLEETFGRMEGAP